LTGAAVKSTGQYYQQLLFAPQLCNVTLGPRATLHNFGAKVFSVDLGTSQYLYIINRLDIWISLLRTTSLSTKPVDIYS